MADPRWRIQDGGQPFQILNFIASYCFFSLYKCFLVTSSFSSYYWYFTYLSGKIIRNIEKSEYDVTVTSSLGVASQNWVWGFFVRRWSLCVNFMTQALLVPEIQRGGPRSPPPVTDWPKKPSLNRVKTHQKFLSAQASVLNSLRSFTLSHRKACVAFSFLSNNYTFRWAQYLQSVPWFHRSECTSHNFSTFENLN